MNGSSRPTTKVTGSGVSILLSDGAGTLIMADNIALVGCVVTLVGGDFNLIGSFTGPSSYVVIGDLNQDGNPGLVAGADGSDAHVYFHL